MKKCLGCTIISTNQEYLFRDELVSVYFDIDPISKGHILIMPNTHYQDWDELPVVVLARIGEVAKVYLTLLKEELAPAGYSIMQNGGEFNDLGHFHLHLFPRFSSESFSWRYSKIIDPTAIDFTSLNAVFKDVLNERLAHQGGTDQ